MKGAADSRDLPLTPGVKSRKECGQGGGSWSCQPEALGQRQGVWVPPRIQSRGGGGGVFGQKDSGSGGQLEGTWEGSLMVPERTGALGWARAGVRQVRRKSEGPCSGPVRLSVLPPQSLLLL